MATEEKKRYWLKLDKDFLKSSQIKVIKNMPNGKDYVIFYLALMLESVETIGHLRFSNLVPYNEEMLASVTDTNVDIVRSAVKIFESLGLMELLDDGTIYMTQVAEMTGKESESINRVRAYRERIAKRKNIELTLIKKISKEQILLPNGKSKFIDNKRYGGNAEYVYELANCQCEVCGETESDLLLIHHNNGYSNDLEDLFLLCKKCHSNVENGNITNLIHKRSVTCNSNVTKSNDNKEKEKDEQSTENKEDVQVDLLQTTTNNIFNYIEENFRRTIAPIEYETINSWLSLSFKKNDIEKIICYAVKIAVMSNKKTFGYVNGILNNWIGCSFLTMQQILDNEIRKNQKLPKMSDEVKELFDYDWLNDKENVNTDLN